jgi:alpha-beta hydrolase superfamily lysophospholipase
MNATAPDQRHFAPSSRADEPLYFPSGDYKLFGWLHRPAAEQTADVGLVICKPFGYESICAHRSVRAFAEAAAALGVPALRFDYVGTGDSEDVGPATDQLVTWTRDVLAAVSELQRCTGVERVCLLGFRLGALLATLAAAQCETVTALVVIAPVISGRRYLRELRMIQLAASQAVVVAPTGKTLTDDAKSAAPLLIEVSGFSLSPATIAALSQVNLMTRVAPPAPQILVIDRSDLPGALAWTDAVSGLGARTKYLCLPGIVEMMWTAPHFATIPQSMIAAMSDWLAHLLRARPAPVNSGSAVRHTWRPKPPLTALRLQCDPSISEATLTERPVVIASEPNLFGIVTEPRSEEARRTGVILLNDGATYHIGANRLNVSLARHWARCGYVVLRMDLAGLGDSATRPGRPGNEVFPPAALEDIRAATEFMREHYAVRSITIGGLCAGAYHALRAALTVQSVNGIFMVNPQTFFWKEGMTIADLQLAEVVRRRALSTYWRRLLTGQVNVWKAARIYMRRPLLALESRLRDIARGLHIRLPNDLGCELEEVAARGIWMLFVFSRDDAGIDLLNMQAGSSIKRLGERCRVHVIDGADHIFSQSGPRQVLEDILSDELFARSPGGRSAAVHAVPER